MSNASNSSTTTPAAVPENEQVTRLSSNYEPRPRPANGIMNNSRPHQPTTSGPTPSIRLLFSCISWRHVTLLLFPAILSSIISGAIAPFTAHLVGTSFDAFTHFPLTPNPPEQAKRDLLHTVRTAALLLVALAGGALVLSSVSSCLWICLGERNVMELRRKVYTAVMNKEMAWFDMKMGAEPNMQNEQDDGPLGAGGLMAKFTRETDDVRAATSLASGILVQSLSTIITSLILSFLRSYALTLVILSSIPLLIIIQSLSSTLSTPLLSLEHHKSSTAASLVSRTFTAISTLKAHNAQPLTHASLAHTLHSLNTTELRTNALFGVTSALSQFLTFAMFVQGFWFGAKLVREGKVSAGDVMAVFFACLIVAGSLQVCIPQFIVLAKGKFAMAGLMALVVGDESGGGEEGTGTRKGRGNGAGEFTLMDVSFEYPSRPGVRVLDEVNMFLPAGEMTFIVGGSGCGKSTVAALLMGMYVPGEGYGRVLLDGEDVCLRAGGAGRSKGRGVACVGQEGCVFDMSVFENVVMGAGSGGGGGEDKREDVEEACRGALMDGFVRGLPEGYQTRVGSGGVGLSGGQRQRLAIARARMRDPKVLILDEATCALDSTTRTLVFEGIKRWRRDRTTVVITHDVAQIGGRDFVYVMNAGRVVENGYRDDLEESRGVFWGMAESQGRGGVRERSVRTSVGVGMGEEVGVILRGRLEREERRRRRAGVGSWMFDDVVELARGDVEGRRDSRFLSPDVFRPGSELGGGDSRRASRRVLEGVDFGKRKSGLRVYHRGAAAATSNVTLGTLDEHDEFGDEKKLVARSEVNSATTKSLGGRVSKMETEGSVKVDSKEGDMKSDEEYANRQGFWKLMRDVYPTVPYKPFVLLGIAVCLVSGAITPLFSFMLSRLLFEVSIGATHVSTINIYGGIVLGIAAADGVFIGLKYFIMETAGIWWTTRLRNTCFRILLAQDMKFFDKAEHSPPSLVQVLIKDGDDARNLIAVVVGQCLVVCAMVGVGLVWAFVQGWQLTLVGVGMAPVFAVVMAFQTGLVGKCELRNKRAREEVAKVYYEAISNVRGIRFMGLEPAFRERFDKAARLALSSGVRGAFAEGCTYGVASALIYLAEALLFYVGAVLIANGTYTYLRMVEVLNLVVFTVILGSQLMAFTEKIAKSTQATRDFNRLLQLSPDTDESYGNHKPRLKGDIMFHKVSFSYPERPDVQILNDISINIGEGECVAIVGASGSGKSTVAALLQRLYEPDSGMIAIGPSKLHWIDVHHLREHVAVVSQNPNLFDATITENIAYGNENLTEADVHKAAKAANIHDFIVSLPDGYDTMVGENASLISGGQAQRLQIARALARPSKILILDECTSALDPANQAAVMETIQRAKVGRTTIMITHKIPMMRMCDRILVMHDGDIKEQGRYETLMAQKGLFAQLISGGELAGT